MDEHQNKVALVTGASRGIGAAVAKELARVGMKVVLCARDADRTESVAAEIRGAGGEAIAASCDVCDYAQVEAAVQLAVDSLGSLDVLVNNAGRIDPIARIADSDPAQWAAVVDANYKGTFHGIRAALPVMLQQGSGTIVNISSGAATSALEGWSHYCSSKAAAKMLTACAHKEVGESGIRVVGLSPGTVATDMQSAIRDSGINPVSKIDWSRHISAEWAARAVAFLCGPAGAEFAGTDFSIKTEEGRKRVGLT